MRHIPVECERKIPVTYKGITIDCGYRLDMLVDNLVVVELKTVDAILPIHEAQIMSYLRLGGWPVGLLINFKVGVLKKGIRRVAMDFKEEEI